MVEIIGFTLIIATAVVFTLIGLLYTKGKKLSVEDFMTTMKSKN